MKKMFLYSLMFILMFGVRDVNALEINNDYVLDKDLKEQVVVTGKEVTLNLNGHNIVVGANGAVMAKGGVKLTITGNGTIESTNSNGIVVGNGSTIIMESGNIKSVEAGALVTGKATFTMNGGVITTSDNCGIMGNGQNNDGYRDYTINFNGGTINGNIKSNGYVSCGIYHPNRGTVNVTGGVINSSNGAGIVQRAGTLNVTGGTINAKGTTQGKVGDSRVVVTSSAIVVDKEANYPEVATLDTKVSSNAILNGDAEVIKVLGSDEKIELTGGIYSSEPESGQIPDGYSAYQVIAGDNEDKYVVVKEEDLETVTVSDFEEKDNLSSDDVALIEKTIKDNYDLASFYNAGVVVVTPAGDIVDIIEETTEAVEVKFELPNTLPKLENGYVRKYYVIRVHNGKVTVIDNVTVNNDGTVSFKSDKFSTYALAYKDVKEETKVVSNTVKSPNTGDGIMKYIIFTFISAIGLVITYLFRKKYN